MKELKILGEEEDKPHFSKKFISHLSTLYKSTSYFNGTILIYSAQWRTKGIFLQKILDMTIRIPVVFCCLMAAAYAAIAPGENAYLPPKNGYNYPKPNVPFPSGPAPRPPSPPPQPRPSYSPPTRPPQATIPPPFQPSPSPFNPPSVPFKPTGRPTYIPPTQTPFRPQPPSPPVRPTPPQRPSGTRPPGYLPPQGPPSRPPGYGPPSTPPPYRPPQQPISPPARPIGPPGPRQPPREGGPVNGFGENDHLLVPHKPGNPFDFKYEVKDEFGNDYSHNAINDGDTTNGEYRVQLPDGRVQVVKYTANWASGFHAKISYEGQPTYRQPPTQSGGGGYPSQRPIGPTGPGPQPPKPIGGQNYSPNGGYNY
ncbi:hypothetical protein ABEB36_007511 [Hypothenemus hampei]|uniref:Uncharacterized protein n=1 Tax=Hypothenemus hampei TaxID=57062 RepID=A0ABD1EWM3_HYPHA